MQLTTQLNLLLDHIDSTVEPIRKMFAQYSCAAMLVETKFKMLDEQFSAKYDENPIVSISTRIKTPDSIMRKLERKGFPYSLDSIRRNLHDIAGVRIVCSFIEDIFVLADYLLSQEDIQLVEKKDYISNPKPNGYRSLHLIIRVPVYTDSDKQMVDVEVQLRTIAMDCWANLEHKVRYNKNLPQSKLDMLSVELKECADMSAELDRRMQSVRQRMAAQ